MSNYEDHISMSSNIHHVTKMVITQDESSGHGWYDIEFKCKDGASYHLVVHDRPEICIQSGVVFHEE